MESSTFPDGVSVKIQNIIASVRFPFQVKLDEFASKVSSEVSYDVVFNPEEFPGVIIKFPKQKVIDGVTKKYTLSVTIFRTGLANVVGAKDMDDIAWAVNTIYELIEKSGAKY
jgi:TATA-box binding protein (TBP) (component of TFIID and TFIIIB)